MRIKRTVVSIVVFILSASFALAATMTIRPNGQGNYANWSNTGCGSGSSEWQCVDEATANTSDYVYTSSSNVKESFGFGDTALGAATIQDVTLYFYAKRYSSSRRTIQSLIRSGSTDYLGNTHALTSSYVTYNQKYTTNPATGTAWTLAQVDAVEAGMSSYSTNYGGYVAQVYAIMNYTAISNCSDSDGGYYPSTYGTAYGYLNGIYYSVSDSCFSASMVTEQYCSGSNRQAQNYSCGYDGYHYYCDGSSSYRNYTDYYCASDACAFNISGPEFVETCSLPYQCINGTCNIPNSCSDSDGGIISYTLGSTTGYYLNSWYNNTDYCLNTTILKEYYCIGDIWSYYINVNCAGNYTSCSDGVCV